ncbi:MAG: MFS transporter [Acidobacteria bacterium]|nr:MFS transporter [Acidobacteriota bacterium]
MRDSREKLYLVSCAAMSVFGIVLALPGTVLGLPEVVGRFDLTLADRGVLIATLFVGLLAGSVASGPVVDAIGHRVSLGVSAALVAIGLPLFTVAQSYTLALVSLAAIGLASAGINTAANALCSETFPGELGRRMNGIAIAVGIGGLSMPAATALLGGYVSWSGVVIGGAMLAAAVAIAALRMAAPGESAVAVPAAARIPAVLRQSGLIWFALLVTCAAGTEASMAGFTSTYLTTLGFTPKAATWALSSHWVGLITGRLVLARLVDRGKRRAIAAAALTGAAALLVFAMATTLALLAAAPFAVGLAIAIVMPTTLALAGERYREHAGTLFGILLTVAQAGAIVLPAAVGVVGEYSGVRAGMSILVVNNLLVAAICLKAAGRTPRR